MHTNTYNIFSTNLAKLVLFSYAQVSDVGAYLASTSSRADSVIHLGKVFNKRMCDLKSHCLGRPETYLFICGRCIFDA